MTCEKMHEGEKELAHAAAETRHPDDPRQGDGGDAWPEVARVARPLSMPNPAVGDAAPPDGTVRPFPHRAYERLAEYCGGGPGWEGQEAVRPPGDTAAGRRPGWHPSQGRSDVCQACDARRSCCYCRANVDQLRLFARRMAELHEPTGTAVCGCGAHNCYVRRRLDDVGGQVRP